LLESKPLDRRASLAMTRMWFKLIGNGSSRLFLRAKPTTYLKAGSTSEGLGFALTRQHLR
jgi:hypothetical protein